MSASRSTPGTVPRSAARISPTERRLHDDLAGVQAVLSCLPYHLNRQIAEVAHELGIHYFDLTEDVATTKSIIELSATAKGLMAPQCGLAPGFVGIVAAVAVGAVRQVPLAAHAGRRPAAAPHRAARLRVQLVARGRGERVPQRLRGHRGGRSASGCRRWSGRETLYIDGVQLEAFTTSGGLGTMCETYHGRVDNIDYKTIRYPGHMDLMNFFFHELLMRERRRAGRRDPDQRQAAGG